MDAGWSVVRRREELDGFRERQIRVRGAQPRDPCRDLDLVALSVDHGGRFRRLEGGHVLAIRVERQVPRLRPLNSPDPADLDRAVAFELTLDAFGNVS
jgi:hypothetical protein